MAVKTVCAAGLVALALIGVALRPAVARDPYLLVALGDSLTAGYGLLPGQAFPEQLEAALTARGFHVRVANAGVSGDTASGGLARLDWSVPQEADGVIVALGANDALRGIAPEVTRQALTEIVDRLLSRRKRVLLAGMLAPRNLGAEYVAAFDAIYRDLGARPEVVFFPFFLEDVAGVPELNQADGIHPTAQGIARIVDNILPYAEAMVSRIEAR